MRIRKVLFWAHLAAGLTAGGVILSMAVSGILISYEPQIVAWAERDLRRVEVPASGGTRLSLDALLAKASEASSKGRPSAILLTSNPSASVAVSLGKEGGNLYLDPYTGRILGKSSRVHAALHAVEEWHRWLGSKEIGKPVTGAANIFVFFLLLSGLYLWWPRKGSWSRAAFRAVTVPGFRLKGKARDWNWHNAVGFWAAPLLLVTTLTGMVVSYRWTNDLLFVLAGDEPPPRPREEGTMDAGKMASGSRGEADGMPNSKDRGAAATTASLDTLFGRAEALVPTWSSMHLRLPQKSGDPVIAAIIEPGFSRRYARSQLLLNASTTEVVKWEPYQGQNLGRRLRSWVVPLHTGRAGGLAGQFLALLSASGAVLLVWTGAATAWRRVSKSRKPPAEPDLVSKKPILENATIGSLK